MAITPKSEDKYVEKCSTAQSFIRTEMSTYRIGTLVIEKIIWNSQPSASNFLKSLEQGMYNIWKNKPETFQPLKASQTFQYFEK